MRERPGTTLDATTLAGMIEVPHQTLSSEALRGVIEEYVTRAGTDYGARETAIEEKIADVERQLERGEAIIVFDADTATINIVRSDGGTAYMPRCARYAVSQL